jgi:zinc transport system substrate-binding protein
LAGDKVDFSLTLPPSMSAHSYEPTPSTVIDVLEADLFIYSSDALEPWVEDVLTENETDDLVVLNLSMFVALIDGAHDHDHEGEEEHDEDEHDHGDIEYDPHYWSDPMNVKLMVNTIARELERLLPSEVETIQANRDLYLEELDHLHEEFLHLEEYRTTDYMMHGGHNAIGYFVERYNLVYVNPYEGFSTDAEPTPSAISNMIDLMNTHNIEYLFSEKLISDTVASTIKEQTGAEILYLYAGGNLSKDDFDSGLTFLEMMEHNLEQYKIGFGYDEADHEH